MSGSIPLIDQVDFASLQKEVVANRVNNAEAPSAVYGIKALTALSLVLYGGTIDVAGTPTVLANQTVALTNNTTNYVYATSAGVITVATSAPAGWPGPLALSAMALYTIVTSGGTVTASGLTEWRIAVNLSAAAAGVTYSDFVGDNGGSPNSGVHGLVPAPNQGDAAAGKVLGAAGTWTAVSVGAIAVFVGDTGGSPDSGVKGLVPAPAQGDAAARKFLFSDGTWQHPPRIFAFAASDETTALTTGGSPSVAAITVRVPYAMTLTGVRANVRTASSSGLVTVDIQKNGTTILSTMLTIDANEKTSTTAATPAVLSATAIADDDEIEVFINGAGTAAAGLKIALIGY